MDLEAWASRPRRKPLVIRGARQVGKTWLARDLASRSFSGLVEVNFDRDPEKADLFSADIERTLRLLSVDAGCPIVDGETLLFLDEIQSAPEVIPLLRYFHEERPGLHVVAAGSLLEFLLAEHAASMPVGRIEFMQIGPMGFGDFLAARGEDALAGLLGAHGLRDSIPDSLHGRLMEQTKLFCVVGGMPGAVQAFVDTGDLQEVNREHESILQTYEHDFGKYQGRVDHATLTKVFRAAPRQVGRKLKYVNLTRDAKAPAVAAALNLLELARVVHSVCHTAATGVPLEAEVKRSDRKLLFLDVGLLSAALGLALTTLDAARDLTLVHSGAVAEQLIGQHLLYSQPSHRTPQLHYWNREKRGSAAELDYVVSHEHVVVPVEVKAGKSGTLKSLIQFAGEKGARLAVRFDACPPSVQELSLPGREPKTLGLISLPHYLVGETRRLLDKGSCPDL